MSLIFSNEKMQISIEQDFVKIDFEVQEVKWSLTKTAFMFNIMDLSNALLELVNKNKSFEQSVDRVLMNEKEKQRLSLVLGGYAVAYILPLSTNDCYH